jgi:dihydrofolate synthase/folylpolyglutamate synthase
MLAAVLQEAGYKTGLYTSPHISDFGERIRINGSMIKEYFVIEFTERIKDACVEIQPSFFEVSVAMAFAYFAQEKTDIVVVETGLGGRLDSTNIIEPILSVITTIGYDHMDILGETLAEIAGEKAGIIKQNIPVVVGESNSETRNVFIDVANERSAPITFAEEESIIEYIADEGGMLLCNIKNVESGVVEKLRLDLVGLYQAKNARTVLSSIQSLKKMGLQIPENALHQGMENVKGLTGLRGRWDVVQKKPTVILDAAHNADGIAQVIDQLNKKYASANIHFVIGFVKDKHPETLLDLFPTESKFYFTNAHIPRALPHAELKKMANEKGLSGNSYDDINEAIGQALDNASEEDVIMVCGSFYVLGEIRNYSPTSSLDSIKLKP